MTRRVRLLCLTIATVLCAGCEHSPSPKPRRSPRKGSSGGAVTVVAVVVHPSARLVNFVGTRLWQRGVTCRARRRADQVVERDLGDHVDAGQALAQIDDDSGARGCAKPRRRSPKPGPTKPAAANSSTQGHLDAGIRKHETHAASASAARHADLTIRHARVDAPISGAVAAASSPPANTSTR